MILDGKIIQDRIKQDLKRRVAALGFVPRLAVVVVGDDAASHAFIEVKKKFAKEIGVDVRVYTFPQDISTTKLRAEVSKIVHIPENRGVVVQLPLPEHILVQHIVNAVMPEKDVDVLSARAIGNSVVGVSRIESPVVGAVAELLGGAGVSSSTLLGKTCVVLGAGRLVGRPVASWLIRGGATVSVVTEHTKDIAAYTKEADIVVTGVGKPGTLTGDMISKKTIVIDAGTSESKGKLVGDADSVSIKEVAHAYSPVPGGVGPITVAKLYENLLTLIESRKTRT